MELNKMIPIVTCSLALVAPVESWGAGGQEQEQEKSRFEKLLEQANTSFRFLDFEGALQILDQARVIPGRSKGDLVRILALKGLCLAPLGREEEAEHAFVAVLSLDPAYRLDPDLSPRYRKPFDRVLGKGVSRLLVEVEAPAEVTRHEKVTIKVLKTSDPAKLADHVLVHFRSKGAAGFTTQRLDLPESTGEVDLSLDTSDESVIEWYAEVFDRHGILLDMKGDRGHPLAIAVLEPRTGVVSASETARQGLLATATGSETIVATLQDSGADASAQSAGDIPKPPEPGAEHGENAKHWYDKWWIWSLIGGSAIAVVATSVVLATALRPTNDSRDVGVVFH